MVTTYKSTSEMQLFINTFSLSNHGHQPLFWWLDFALSTTWMASKKYVLLHVISLYVAGPNRKSNDQTQEYKTNWNNKFKILPSPNLLTPQEQVSSLCPQSCRCRCYIITFTQYVFSEQTTVYACNDSNTMKISITYHICQDALPCI